MRLVRIVAQRLADLADAEVQGVLEIHVDIGVPQFLADGFAGDQAARRRGQHSERLCRFGGELHDAAVLAQLAGFKIELEGPELNDAPPLHPLPAAFCPF